VTISLAHVSKISSNFVFESDYPSEFCFVFPANRVGNPSQIMQDSTGLSGLIFPDFQDFLTDENLGNSDGFRKLHEEFFEWKLAFFVMMEEHMTHFYNRLVLDTKKDV